ncbi:hypothetical protein NKH23_25455 [Mesorhizobium sp. M1328]|uniref:hypothetical protein n=1 Tax=Mesorhizobium sp. M1328 TaxID=2957082 RepID=UPI0033364F7A
MTATGILASPAMNEHGFFAQRWPLAADLRKIWTWSSCRLREGLELTGKIDTRHLRTDQSGDSQEIGKAGDPSRPMPPE